MPSPCPLASYAAGDDGISSRTPIRHKQTPRAASSLFHCDTEGLQHARTVTALYQAHSQPPHQRGGSYRKNRDSFSPSGLLCTYATIRVAGDFLGAAHSHAMQHALFLRRDLLGNWCRPCLGQLKRKIEV
jgi:hypothetical protein